MSDAMLEWLLEGLNEEPKGTIHIHTPQGTCEGEITSITARIVEEPEPESECERCYQCFGEFDCAYGTAQWGLKFCCDDCAQEYDNELGA